MGKEQRPFCCHRNFVPNMLSAPARGYIHVGKHEKICIKSDFKEIVLKLATNGQSDKGFLLISTFVPKGLSAPALGLYTCIKALKYIPGVRCLPFYTPTHKKRQSIMLSSLKILKF